MQVNEYKILSPVYHLGRKFAPGEIIVLNDTLAAGLPAHCIEINLPGDPSESARKMVAQRVQRLRDGAEQSEYQQAEAQG